tara:strand:- start:802 stop:2019 length:1218 start_codon:yes stop_codon:yes gene_type:complete
MNDIGKMTRASREAQNAMKHNRGAVEMAQEAAGSPTLKSVLALRENTAVARILQDVERERAMMGAVEGPLAELRRAGVFNQTSQLNEEFRKTQQMMEEFKARFTLPETTAAMKLMQEFQKNPLADVMKRYAEQASEIQKAMEAMRTPWLDAQQALKSMAGFAEIQGIGSMLSRLPTFDNQVSLALRADLGDWRDKITWPKPVLTDLSARAEVYVGLGFDPALTDFPAPAFQESTAIAGLHRAPPPVIEAYRDPIFRAEDAEEEEALVRTNAAHDRLQRLETNLRNYIDNLMTAAFGPDWPRYRLPNGLYDQWVQKQENAEKAGRQPKRLVAYADFTDYELVICKRDNWREVFGSHFGRPESVRESFQRLHLIRIDTMHSRPIGQDDELLLYVEVKRLVSAIRPQS